MKTLPFILCLLLLPLAGYAAESAAAIADTLPIKPNGIAGWLTPLLVSMMLAGLKRWLPALPSGIIPYLAPVLGAIIELVNMGITNNPGNLLTGALLGALGVSLREMKEGLMKAGNGGWPVK